MGGSSDAGDGGSNDGWSSVGLYLYSNGSSYGADGVIGNYRYWSDSESHLQISTPGTTDDMGAIPTMNNGLF